MQIFHLLVLEHMELFFSEEGTPGVQGLVWVPGGLEPYIQQYLYGGQSNQSLLSVTKLSDHHMQQEVSFPGKFDYKHTSTKILT